MALDGGRLARLGERPPYEADAVGRVCPDEPNRVRVYPAGANEPNPMLTIAAAYVRRKALPWTAPQRYTLQTAIPLRLPSIAWAPGATTANRIVKAGLGSAGRPRSC